jgi:PAS domain S-box-containing protein
VNSTTSRLEPRNRQIAELIKRLHATEQELRHLTGGEVDGVISSEGQPYLLREAQERLRQSTIMQRELAAMQKTVIDALPAHIALIDSTGIIVSVNEAWRRFATAPGLAGPDYGIGKNYVEICDKAQGDCGEEGPASAAGIRRVLSGELKEFALEFRCHSPAEQRWFREIVTPLSEYHLDGAVVTHIDITERKLAELGTQRINRVYALLSQVKSVMAHVRDPQLLYEGACHVAVATGGMAASWIGLFEADESHARVVAQAGRIDGYLDSVLQPTDLSAEGPGPFGSAVRQNRPTVCNDIANDPLFSRWRQAALERGYRSVAAFPLRMEQKVFGVFLMYAEQPHFFDAEEIKLLDQLADDVSFAIKLIGEEKQRLQAETATRLSEGRLKAVFEQAAVGICIISLDYRFLRVNQRLCEILGFSAEELVSLENCAEVTFLDDRLAENTAFIELLSGKKSVISERRCVCKDGKVIWARFTFSLLVAFADRPRQFLGVVEDITERKQSEQQLNLLGTCIANLNDIVIVAEADLIDEPGPKIVFVNEAFERLTGYSRAEVIGRSPRFLQGKDTDRQTLDEIRQALVEKKAIRKQILNYGKNGTPYWLDLDIVPIFDSIGKTTHFAAIERDITKSKETEKALAESNRALRMLNSCNEALIHSETESGLLIAVCRSAVEIGGMRMAWVGYAAEDRHHIISPQAHAGQEEGYLSQVRITWLENDPLGRGPAGQVIRTGEPVVIPDLDMEPTFAPWLEPAKAKGFRGLICLPLKGQKRTFGVLVLYLAEVRHVQSGEIKLLMDLARDLAFGIKHIRSQVERLQMQAAIREQASFLDKAQDAIAVRDLDHRITYWNKSAERLYGWTAGEALGTFVRELLHRKDPGAYDRAMVDLLATGEWSGELKKTTREGRDLTIECRWTLMRDDDGQPKSVLSIGTDITEKKKLEAQFMRAQRMESIGTLAGGVAHDLNNILAPIMMSIDILKMKSDNPQTTKILETIQISAKRGADIVRQVLSFARGMDGERVEI